VQHHQHEVLFLGERQLLVDGVHDFVEP
jgi:hypothetical protein